MPGMELPSSAAIVAAFSKDLANVAALLGGNVHEETRCLGWTLVNGQNVWTVDRNCWLIGISLVGSTSSTVLLSFDGTTGTQFTNVNKTWPSGIIYYGGNSANPTFVSLRQALRQGDILRANNSNAGTAELMLYLTV